MEDTSVKKSWIAVLLGTAVAMNMMLIGLLVAREVITLPQAIPATAESAVPDLRTEVQLEWVGSRTKGDWRIEEYQKVEVQLDEKGHIVSKHPTSEMTYMRYWNPSS
ncbi:hypothetical protein [Marininema halotolerans]|uniref:Uncharacterized protein n=1 Tax=Marininema halotolerans TaxID=1155944 RepID=A0A1I6U0W7_9BACL|nr:hypothetical protein [Marininema halotolerans]SFS95116.1 hypothetical protein SAMN05444972_11292 [Marininema halotolerans]